MSLREIIVDAGQLIDYVVAVKWFDALTAYVNMLNVDFGVPAEKAEGVRFVKREENAAIYEIGSGSYHFVVDNCPLSISPP